jgi:hypothetical protein
LSLVFCACKITFTGNPEIQIKNFQIFRAEGPIRHDEATPSDESLNWWPKIATFDPSQKHSLHIPLDKANWLIACLSASPGGQHGKQSS